MYSDSRMFSLRSATLFLARCGFDSDKKNWKIEIASQTLLLARFRSEKYLLRLFYLHSPSRVS